MKLTFRYAPSSVATALAVLAVAASVNAQTIAVDPPELSSSESLQKASLQAYWAAKAQCWADLSQAEASQGDTHDTAVIAAGNAQRIRAALQAGAEPDMGSEQPIFAQKFLPSNEPRYGRPKWRADIARIDEVVASYHERRCRTPKLGCLEVVQASVYENMEETRGARWNHGRPEIDKALALAAEAGSEFEASCAVSQETLASVDNLPKIEPLDVVELPADMLFRFDQGDEQGMLPGGRSSIGDVASKIRGYGNRTGSLQIIGYADRLGTPDHNETLSTQRASTVAVLLQAAGVTLPMQPIGAGAAKPVTGDECGSVQPRQALVACLQPDRRVVVRVMPSTQ